MPYPQLSGHVASASAKRVGLPIATATVALAVLTVVFVVATRPPEPTAAATTTESDLPAPVTEASSAHPTSPDTAFHLASVKEQLVSASEQIKRAQQLTARMVPELTRLDLWQERRRAEGAVAASENARQAVDRALAELEVAIPTNKESVR